MSDLRETAREVVGTWLNHPTERRLLSGLMYLTGATGGISAEIAERWQIGLMLQPNSGYVKLAETWPYWAADNGCFSQGARFKVESFLTWLETVPRNRCLFAVAPDVLGDSAATLERSRPVLPELRGRGFRAAFVAQDGAESMRLPWFDFDALFLGGTTHWKLSAAAATVGREAKIRGKWLHMGRVNSLRRLERARLMGVDSVDGTYLKFGPRRNLPKLLAWLRRLREQPCLTF